MSNYLFAYGTLQPGHVAEEIAPVVAKFRPVGKGNVRGLLYDLGEYPGAILTSSSSNRISGTVFQLPEDPDVLQQLDEYEGFDPRNPETSLFIRKIHPVSMSEGKTVACWIYEYNRKPAAARLVESGSYRKRSSGATRSRPIGAPRAKVANK